MELAVRPLGLVPSSPTVFIDYIWLTEHPSPVDGRAETLWKTKIRVMQGDALPQELEEVPCWVVDGESSHQQPSKETEVLLRPVFMCRDPFRARLYGQHNQARCLLVLCEVYKLDFTPVVSNTRYACSRLMHGADPDLLAQGKCDRTVPDLQAWVGIEQEYQLLDGETRQPHNWPTQPGSMPESLSSNVHYCGTGPVLGKGRRVMEEHLAACLFAGLHMCVINAEVQVGMLEYALSPLPATAAGDELWMSRYILARVAEEHGLAVTFAAKPVPTSRQGHGAGLHFNISTAATRTPPPAAHTHNTVHRGDPADGQPPPPASRNALSSSAAHSSRAEVGSLVGPQVVPDNQHHEAVGYEAILACIEKLAATHMDCLEYMGPGNEDRLVGNEECASIATFSYGVGSREPHVRIPRDTERRRYGHFEDRRAAANADPYLVIGCIVKTLAQA